MARSEQLENALKHLGNSTCHDCVDATLIVRDEIAALEAKVARLEETTGLRCVVPRVTANGTILIEDADVERLSWDVVSCPVNDPGQETVVAVCKSRAKAAALVKQYAAGEDGNEYWVRQR